MAILRYKDIKGMAAEDLKLKMQELRKELVKHNTQRSTGTPLKESGKIREIKRTIARIYTFQNAPKEQPKKEPSSKNKKAKEE